MEYDNPGRSPVSLRINYLLALGVLAAGLILTYVIYRITFNSEVNAEQARFTRYAGEVSNTVSAKLTQYLAVLDSSAGLFAGSTALGREDWERFGDTIRMQDNYPGISSLQYLSYVNRDALPRFLASLRTSGIPGTAFRPVGDRDYYCPITYAIPRSADVFVRGYDACHSQEGREVLMQARDTGANVISAPMDLHDAQGKVHRGFVAVRALYGNDMPVATVAERRKALYGWVAETLPMDRVMAGLIPSNSNVDVSIRDQSLAPPADVLYQESSGTGQDQGFWQRRLGMRVSYSTDMSSGGRTWTLAFSEPGDILWMPVFMLLAGVLVTLPFSLLVLNLGLTRSRAIRLADEMTQSLREQEQLLSSITSNISDGIYRSSLDRGMIYANDALARMFGYNSAAELTSVAGPILYANPARRKELEVLLDTHGQYHDQEVEYQRKDGTRFFGLNSAVTVCDPDGSILFFDGVISDITERKRAEEKVYQLAHYDTLTGLPNRALLRDRLGQMMRDASRRDTHIALMFLDLDHFKTVNDSLGHDVGDELLKAVARRLVDQVRDSDTVSRQGGDEFLVTLREIVDADAAARVAENMLHAVARPYHIGRHELHITPSIGITLFPDDSSDIDTLIRNADAAMYHAKENGRFNFQFFTPEMNARAYERLSLEMSLRQAFERREFSLFYQPQVNLRSGQIVGMEALLRWHSPERGMVEPSVFVPILESSGLIGPVGEWLLGEACRQNRSWQEAGLPALPVAVNLSPFQFRRRNMADMIAGVLTETRLAPHHLELEFTESALMQETREVGDVIRRLNALGVRMSIDDFGTGYSSLSYLKRFQIDKLKIDQSFVRDIGSDPDDAAITSAIISLARDLKVAVVAEGVETAEQLEFMRQRGCDDIQGYLFSPPLPADRFADLLASGRRLEDALRVPREA